MYLHWRRCMKVWSPEGPWGLPCATRFKVTFVFLFISACTVWILYNEHVLFIEPEIAHRKPFSLEGGQETKEACLGTGTLLLRRLDASTLEVVENLGVLPAPPVSRLLHPVSGGQFPPPPGSISLSQGRTLSGARALVSYLNGHHRLLKKLFVLR